MFLGSWTSAVSRVCSPRGPRPRCPSRGRPAPRRPGRPRGGARRAPSRWRAAPPARPGDGPRQEPASCPAGAAHPRPARGPPGRVVRAGTRARRRRRRRRPAPRAAPRADPPVRRGHRAEGVAGAGGRRDEGRGRDRPCPARRRERGPALWTHRSPSQELRGRAPRRSGPGRRRRRRSRNQWHPPAAPAGAARLGGGRGHAGHRGRRGAAPRSGPGRGGGQCRSRGARRGAGGPGRGRCSGRPGRRGCLRRSGRTTLSGRARQGRKRRPLPRVGPLVLGPRVGLRPAAQPVGTVRGVLDVDVAEVDGGRARPPERGRRSGGRGRRRRRRVGGRRRDVVELDVAPPTTKSSWLSASQSSSPNSSSSASGTGSGSARSGWSAPPDQYHLRRRAARDAARVELLGVLAPWTARTARPGDGLVREEVLGAALFASEAHP